MSSSSFAASSPASIRKSRSAAFSPKRFRSRTPRRCSGAVELEENGARSAVAVVHGFVENQGDAWTVTSAYLDRFVEEQRLLTAEAAGHSDEQAAYLRRMEQVGRRVAEMQLALASRDDIADFAPEPIAADDVRAWTDRRPAARRPRRSTSWRVADRT